MFMFVQKLVHVSFCLTVMCPHILSLCDLSIFTLQQVSSCINRDVEEEDLKGWRWRGEEEREENLNQRGEP